MSQGYSRRRSEQGCKSLILRPASILANDNPNMWAVMCEYFTYLYCLWIFLSWLPSYLVSYRGFTLLKMGSYAALPLDAVGRCRRRLADRLPVCQNGECQVCPSISGDFGDACERWRREGLGSRRS